jgi:diphthamide synthase (EF-2-diphthine--ammonia ligase)
MYGKSYFSLGVTEKMTLDQMVFGTIASNYQSITAEGLASHKSKEPIGFRVPSKPKT